jgi:poly(3-hydroxybutyrate) depolymerase
VKRAVLSLALLLCLEAAAADRLAGHAANVAGLTASGLSSGGYMAIQLQVTHSSRVTGVAALAAGPYYCAQGSLWTAYYNCATPGTWSPLPDVATLKAETERFAREGRIDPTANLAAARVWLLSGSQDRTVERPVVEAAAQFYAAFGAKNIPVHRRRSGHAMVTVNAGAACGSSEPPFIVDCDYDAAGALLAHLLGPLKPAAEKESGRLVAFDQKPFAEGNAHALSLADAGYAYVPAACAVERCSVHVALHGCRQSADAVGERFVRDAGYNRWADTNRLIVLYPQTIARFGPAYSGGRWSYAYNPRGCWDWWGYTGAQYATKAAPQIRAVMAMVERLGAPRQ